MFTKTTIKDLFIFTPNKFLDERGYFFESYNKNLFQNHGLNYDFIQDNQSYSKYGTIRALHFQTGKFAQAKLVRVLKGDIIDVAVDLRKNSLTYGQHFAVHLSSENNKQLLIPRGFAHGFSVISEEAIVLYKCDNIYSKEHEAGIIYNDQELNINWQIANKDIIISGKDILWPNFREYQQMKLTGKE